MRISLAVRVNILNNILKFKFFLVFELSLLEILFLTEKAFFSITAVILKMC